MSPMSADIARVRRPLQKKLFRANKNVIQLNSGVANT